MKHTVIFLFAILMSQSLPSCKDQSTNENPPITPDPLGDLRLKFVSGYIYANLMPSIPPDPIVCKISIVAENASQTRVFSGLSVLQADVFLNSSNQKLGTIAFTTSWDGQLGPSERDTIQLSKVVSQTTLFSPQCSKQVFLNLIVQDESNNTIALKTDSLDFGCVY
jgi:hypothetical protein